MSNQNSIIGRGYIPHNLLAVCHKTNNNVNLGDIEYRIIKNPYDRTFTGEQPCSMLKKRCMAIDILDKNTGLTYAVEYLPANLVPAGEKVDFITRARQFAQEINDEFVAKGEIRDKCGIAFFALSDNGDNKTASCVSFVGGRGDRIINSIAAGCKDDPTILKLMKRVVLNDGFPEFLRSRK